MKINKGFLGFIVFFVLLGCFYLWAVENWRIGCLYCWISAPIGFLVFGSWAEYEKNKDFLK